MKRVLTQIVGKTIAGVIVKERLTSPRSQVCLFFTDGTQDALYSANDTIGGGGSVYPGGSESVRKPQDRSAQVILDAFDPPAQLRGTSA